MGVPLKRSSNLNKEMPDLSFDRSTGMQFMNDSYANGGKRHGTTQSSPNSLEIGAGITSGQRIKGN